MLTTWLKLLLYFVCLTMPVAALGDDRSFFESFAQNMGRATFAIAWPTATYEGVRFVESEAGSGVVYAVFRLYGRSAFDGSDLWTDCIVTFRGFSVENVRFGRNNGTVPPGLTAAILTDLIRNLQKDAAKASRQQTEQVWTVTDNCSDKQGVYIRFFDVKNQLAWPDWKTSYHIGRGQSRTFNLNVKAGQQVCYGARPDKNKKKYWGVSLDGTRSCDACCFDSTAAAVPIELTCN